MSKKLWFLLIVFCIAIAILAASRFVAGFDEGANSMVIQPASAAFASGVATVQANPVWLTYGHWISLASGIGLTAFVALILWPKYLVKPSQKSLDTLQEKVRSSAGQVISTASVKKTIPPAPAKTVEPTSKPEVTEEVKPKT